MEKRNIGLNIFLTIITSGLFGLFWFYQILSDLYNLTGQENTAGMDIVYTIITCGFYGYFIAYKMGGMLYRAKAMYSIPAKDNSIMFLVLNACGFGIVTYSIVQDDLNTYFTTPPASGGNVA